MVEQYDPKKIVQLRQILQQAKGLDVLWFTGLEHVPWFEEITRNQPQAQLEQVDPQNQLEWLKNHLRQNRVEGDFLFRLNDLGSVPWTRVMLNSEMHWLDTLVSHSTDFSFIAPNYTLRLDICLPPTTSQIYLWRRSPFDLDADE